ncbi:MAG TPA: chromosome segregation protein SMC [Acidimicrobiales bacterium]|nr:chromosome segregation protein SMC [Acidimicrobiales bacterium]
MFLKALTLKGFKSFAEATVLEMQPGVTVVVGPNGSGKSNVVDAIGWVLGAQAPSAVRSQKMEDVIFAGTTRRPALGRAEVSLTIDNSAGLLPIEFTEVTVTRTLWRSGDSEYALNGVPCRLLDVQELFSDTGVGRQQHVIVGQGQIDAVLNARPEERRLIIEEAAGVLKHRKRKERSERRLAATEANLVRLGDLVREVRRQLRPLERQAEAARRHGDLVAELRELHVFAAGRDLSTLKRRLGDLTAARAEVRNEATLLQRRLAELDTAVLAAETRLAALGGSELADALRMAEMLREKARGQLALVAERRRGVDRERVAFVDRAVIASLEADAARLRSDLAAVEDDAQALGPDADALTETEAALAEDRAAFEREWGSGVAAGPSGRAAEVRGELGALGPGLRQAEGDLQRSEDGAARLRSRLERLEQEVDETTAQITAAEATEPRLAQALESAQARLRQAESAAQATEQRRDATQGERQAWEARREALELALDEARARAGAERLAEVEGVIGTLLDLVDIDPGWEATVEAALGEALAAVVVDSVDAGRRALSVLADGEVAGAVLAMDGPALREAEPEPSGEAVDPSAPLSGGEPVLRHVRPRRADVAPLLRSLLATAVAVDGGWEAAVDAALARPEAVVVTRRGGRFGPTGWRVSTATTGATGHALHEARERAAVSVAAAERALADHRDARVALDAARRDERAAAQRLDDAGRARAAAEAAQQRVVGDRDEAAAELASLAEQQAVAAERLERDRARETELAALLPELEAEEATQRERVGAMGAARRRLDDRATAVAARRADLDGRRTALAERRSYLQHRLDEVEERLAGSDDARRQAEARRGALDDADRALDRLAAFVGGRLALVEGRLQALQERRRRETDAQRALVAELDGLRSERSTKERAVAERRERAQRVEIDEAEVRLRLEQAIERCRTQLDIEPEAAAAAEQPALAEGMTPTVRIRELERELRVMGPVNPLALEEYEALAERHTFLTEQLDDVKSGRRELNKVIRAIDEEIVRTFAAAFADVSENFEQLFATLFPGGQGRLRLTDPDDLLDTGVEVDARPSGKNVKKLSLLSGGERSLTALAFLFAVFRSRPSPFYVMDEVEAALDDVNLHRFLDLVAEFRAEAQLIVVTHQKRTMEAADVLYGVTMQPGGSSKVVSERVAAGA